MHPPSSQNQGSDSSESKHGHHPIFEDTERLKTGTQRDHHAREPIASPFAASASTEPSAAPTSEAQAAGPKPSRRSSVCWTVTALVVGVFAIYFLVSELTTAASMQGTTVGNLINLRAVAPGVVSEVDVDEAADIETGQVIARLDAAGLDTQLQRIEEILDLKRLEADQVARAIDEEKQRLELLHEISKRSETMLGLEIEELDIQLELSSKLASELDGSVRRGSAKKFEFLEAENSRLRLAKRLEEKHGELDLQKLITENAAQGRHYHAGVVRSWLDELQLHAAKVATEIGQTQLEAATLRTTVDQSTISAHRGGRVFAVHHHPGSSVQAGDPIVTLETDDRVWIIASFKYAEAEDIAYGDRATIDFPALGESIRGTVVAIGHNVISATDADSPFLRLTPEEVLVKIEPDGDVDNLRSGISAQVHIRTSSLNPFAWMGSLAETFRSSEKPNTPLEELTEADIEAASSEEALLDETPDALPLPGGDEPPAEKPREQSHPVVAPIKSDTIPPMDSPFDFSNNS